MIIKWLKPEGHKDLLYAFRTLKMHQAILFLEDIHRSFPSSKQVFLALFFQFLKWRVPPHIHALPDRIALCKYETVFAQSL